MDFSSIFQTLTKSAESINSAVGQLQNLPNVSSLKLPGNISQSLQNLQNGANVLQGAQQKLSGVSQMFQSLPSIDQGKVLQALDASKFTDGLQNITGSLEKTLPNIEGVISKYGNVCEQAQGKLGDAFSQIQDQATQAFSAAQDKATNAFGQVQGKVSEAYNGIVMQNGKKYVQ